MFKLGIDREKEIIDAAAELFREKGYERTRLQDIGEKVGLLRGSLYYYIKNKEELLWKVVEPSTLITVEELKAVLNSDMTTGDKIKQAIKQLIHLYHEYYPHVFVFMGEKLSGLSQEYVDAVYRVSKEFKTLWLELINQGKKEGQIREDLDSEIIFQGMFGMCFYMHRWYEIDGRLSSEEIGRVFSTILWEGMKENK
ncbi:MAG: TetR/AcrR family transcriptional regulator [Bacillota bacterium]